MSSDEHKKRDQIMVMSGATLKSLTKKGNSWLDENPHVEIVSIRLQTDLGGQTLLIHYKI